jgi:hypothetical protein
MIFRAEVGRNPRRHYKSNRPRTVYMRSALCI